MLHSPNSRNNARVPISSIKTCEFDLAFSFPVSLAFAFARILVVAFGLPVLIIRLFLWSESFPCLCFCHPTRLCLAPQLPLGSRGVFAAESLSLNVLLEKAVLCQWVERLLLFACGYALSRAHVFVHSAHFGLFRPTALFHSQTAS